MSTNLNWTRRLKLAAWQLRRPILLCAAVLCAAISALFLLPSASITFTVLGLSIYGWVVFTGIVVLALSLVLIE